MIVDKINAYLTQKNTTLDEALRSEVEKLAGMAFHRQFMQDREDKPGTLRLSSCGKCPRQLAYGYHEYTKIGKEIDSRAKLVFWLGDLAELTVISLAKLAGCQLVGTGLNQLTIKIKIGEAEIEGHPDGLVIDQEADEKIKLLEVKSMNSFAFAEFERGNIEPSYQYQLNGYLHALGLETAVMVALNKDSGVLNERIITKDPKIVEKIKENLTSVLQSTQENLPNRAFTPNDKNFLPWNCLYCGYWGQCYPKAKKVLVGKAYRLMVPKEEKIEVPF